MREKHRNIKEHKIKNIIIQYIEENIKSYMILIIVFFIGLILGVIYINNADETCINQVSTYINNFLSSIKENYQISTSTLLLSSIKNNIVVAVILWLLGLTVIGVPIIYLIIGYKGYCLGFTISAIIATLGTGKGLVFVVSTLLLQNVIYIICMLTLSISGLNLYKLIMADRRRENIKLQILKHTIFSLVILIILIGTSFVETYISGKIGVLILKYI